MKLTHTEALNTDELTMGTFTSADYYRVLHANTIVLVPFDNPQLILQDALEHGGSEIRELIEWAVEHGILVGVEPDGAMLDVAGNPDHQKDYRSHIALQIAFPQLYSKYFEGELVWEANDPRMLELFNKASSSYGYINDFLGETQLKDAPNKKNPVGRPKTKEAKKPVSGYKEWVAACGQYKTDLAAATQAVKEFKASASAWKKEQIENINQQYKQGMIPYEGGVLDTQLKLKAQGKPKRADFENE